MQDFLFSKKEGMVMKVRIGVACLVVLLAAGSLYSCGGGGGGGNAPPLTAPTYNVTGTWSIVETITGSNCTPPPSGTFPWFANATQVSGSNTVYVKDSRALADPPAAMTMSGSTITYSGERYNENQVSCDVGMTATYTLNLSSANAFTGSGVIGCQYPGGSCSVNTSIVGLK